MHLKEQLYILEIARTRNITKAAQALGVSQPALSAFLNNLELSLGTKLFERKRKCLELTPVGEIYVQKAEQMLHLKDEFYREMSQLLHEDQLELTVGVQTIRAPHIIAPLSIAISEHFPNLKVTFYENTGEILCRMFEEGKLDLLLCNKRETVPGMHYVTLKMEHVLLAVPPGHPLTAKKRGDKSGQPWIDLSLFKNENFLMLTPDHSIRYYTEQLFESMGWYPQKMVECGRTETTLNMAAAGAGCAFVIETYIPYFRLQRSPEFFRVGNPPFQCEFVAAYPQNACHSPIFERFLELIRFF